jgi:hypothetical protein
MVAQSVKVTDYRLELDSQGSNPRKDFSLHHHIQNGSEARSLAGV